MITWERFHSENNLCWPIRPDGFTGSTTPPTDCCLLLETGVPNEVLLETGGTDCIQPEDC